MVVRELINLIGYEIDEASYKQVEGRSQKLFDGIEKFGKSMSLKVTAPIMAAAAFAVNEFTQYKTALAIINQTLLSTGNAAGKTAAELESMSESLQGQSLYEHSDILKDITGTLLTFDKVSGTTFDRASQGAIDLAARWKLDLQSAAIMVGKALNDPAEGLGLLTRRYVHMTKAEKDHVKAMVDQGRTADAQRYILDMIDRSVGGMAKTVRESSSGFIVFTNKLKETGEMFGEILQPYFKKFYNLLVKLLDIFNKLSPTTKKAVLLFAALAAAIGPIALLLGGLGNAGLATVKGITTIINYTRVLTGAVGGLSLATLGWVALVVAALAVLFLLVEDFMQYMAGGESVIGKFLAPWSELGPKVMAKIQPIIDKLKGLFESIVQMLRGILQVIIGLLTGNVDMIFAGIKNAFAGFWKYLINYFGLIVQWVFLLVPTVLQVLARIWTEVFAWFGRLISGIAEKIKSIPLVGQWLRGLGALFPGGGGAAEASSPEGMPMFSPAPASTTSTRSVNVNSTIAMTVPAGTEAQQVQAVKSEAEKAVKFLLDNHLRSAYLQVQE
jgi:phage-related protein